MPAPSNPRCPVLIVGAGPTGLALALWPIRLGVPLPIVDKAAAAGTTPRAMAVHARSLEFHRQLGIADAAVDAGVRIGGVNLWGRGRKAMRLPIGDIGHGLSAFPYVLDLPQDQHEALHRGHWPGWAWRSSADGRWSGSRRWPTASWRRYEAERIGFARRLALVPRCCPRCCACRRCGAPRSAPSRRSASPNE